MNDLTLSGTQIQAILNNLVSQPSGLNQMLSMTLNAFMKAERTAYLEQAAGNKANGFRSMNGLGIGEGLALSIPRDRLSQFKPWLLTVMREQQEQTNELFFELYSTGLSTREIESITESLYGQRLSRSAISRITQLFAEDMQAFRERQLESAYPIIYLDATFIKTRRDTVSSEAYYTVLGVKTDTTREVLGIYNAPTEAASIWHDIITDLKQRGLQQCRLFVTDDLTGLDNAIEQHFETVTIQKCVLHLKRNLLKKVRKSHRAPLAEDLAQVFDLERADDTQAAVLQRAQQIYQRWYKIYPHLAILNEEHRMSYYFSYLKFHPKIRNMIYTTNWIERLHKDFKRTIKFRNAMPSVESVLTLLTKVAIDKNQSRYHSPVSRLALDSMFQ